MFNKTKSSLALTLSVAMLATMVTIPGVASAATATQLSGKDRYETALKIVEAGWTKSDSAVIARGDDLADALAAAPLAYAKGKSPILLTKTNEIPTGVLAELKALGVKNVYIVGGVGAVSKMVADQLAAQGLTITRVSGMDRFETSLKISKEAFATTPAEVVIANGLAYADALSVSSIAAAKGMPILLVNNNKLSADQAAYIAGKTVYAIGGEGVLNTDVVSAAKAVRVSGIDRYKTNAAVLAKFKPDYSKIYIAKGTPANLVDALAGSALAALTNSPIVLVDGFNKVDTDLQAVVKTNITASSELVKLGGTVTQAAADTIEMLKSGEESIKTVSAIGTKSVKVTFNSAVDTAKAVLNIKKGAAIYGSTVTWNAAKDEATLTAVVNLPAADYSVEVTGLSDKALTKTFTVASEVASKIEVVQKTVALMDSAKIIFKVTNQYGEDMKIMGTTSGVVVSAYNTTQKRVEELTNLTADNKLTFKSDFATTAPAKLGDVIRVTVAYAGLTAQANLTVVDPAASATIAFGTIVPLKDKTRISVSESGLVVPYTMFDQYGVAKTLASHAADAVDNVETISGVQFLSSKPTVVDVDTFAVDSDGKLTFATGAVEGTAIITAIINATGQVATFSVNVNSVGVVDSLVISAPTTLVAAGETVKLPVSATDQFGVAIAAKDVANIDITSSNASVVANGSTITAGKLNVTTLAAGTTVLTAKVGTKVVGTVTVVVEAAAIASQVKSVDFGPKFEIGATKTLTTSNFAVVDQYGRTMAKEDITFTVAEKTTTDTQFAVTGALFTAEVIGSSQFVLTAKDANNNVAAAYEFTASVIASSSITSYAITTVPTIYSGTTHAKALELIGKTSAAETVILKANKATVATSSDTSKVTVVLTNGVATVTGVALQEGTSVVALWNGSTKLAETTVTLSKVAPVITSVKFNDDVETVLVNNVDLLNNLEVKDQYGVAISGSGFWTTSDSSKATVTNGVVTMVGTPATGSTVTIGYVTSNGLVVTTVLTK